MKTIKTFLALAGLAVLILTQSCVSVREASSYEVVSMDDCEKYEADGYHVTKCWDEKFDEQ